MGEKKKARVIAYYLPQFYSIPENDKWWGKGFTEWTNVGKAIPYFRGHYQPRVPADLGYYNLLISEVREAQAEMADEAGVDAFCYWHYWFGNGMQLLEKPLQSVIKSGKPDFPFCLGWANHDWSRKNWNKDESRFSNEFLIKQTYPGKKDIDDHFFTMLSAFSDKRYYTVHGRLLFNIYSADTIPNLKFFIERWQTLAVSNGLPGFYFVSTCRKLEDIAKDPYVMCDAINLDLKNNAFFKGSSSMWRKFSYLLPFPVNVSSYSSAIKKWNSPLYMNDKIYPSIFPNWDHSPRSGKSATILHNSTPELFKKHVRNILELISNKEYEDKIVFLKSWNEWAEGNYMEPDLKYGKEYIKALKSVLMD